MSDHYLSVSTDEDFIERHVDLTNVAAERLRITLGEMEKAGKIRDFTVEPNASEFYTIGYDDTLQAIVEGLGLGDEE